MIADILTVMWKDRKGLMRQGGSRARGAANQLLIVVMLAVIFPIQMGSDWFSHSLTLVAAFVVPMIAVGITVPESFAGERERHTLETLLASRLPDRAILFGKLGLAIIYGWGMAVATLLLGAVVANAVGWKGQVMFYTPPILLANLGISLLASGLTAGLGVLISLRSATAMGATQALMMFLLVPIMILQIVPLLLLTVVPNGMAIFQRLLKSLDFTQVMLVLAAVLLVVDVALLLVAMARFRRARLILS
jgi:ABC-2 type transport system permease protein